MLSIGSLGLRHFRPASGATRARPHGGGHGDAQLAAAYAHVSALTIEVGRLADLVAKGNERAADLVTKVDGEHWKRLVASDWMATDATGLKVLIPKLPAVHNGCLEVYRRDDLVVFQYEADKGSEALADKLKSFAGVLLADAEHRHNAVFRGGRVIEARCNAHGRRKLRDAKAAASPPQKPALHGALRKTRHIPARLSPGLR